MIQREFTGSAGGDRTAVRVTIRVYPPSPTAWIWIAFAGGREFRDEASNIAAFRAWAAGGCVSLKPLMSGGERQDFCVDLLRVLCEVDRDFQEAVKDG